jgi:hypothetical protein
MMFFAGAAIVELSSREKDRFAFGCHGGMGLSPPPEVGRRTLVAGQHSGPPRGSKHRADVGLPLVAEVQRRRSSNARGSAGRLYVRTNARACAPYRFVHGTADP